MSLAVSPVKDHSKTLTVFSQSPAKNFKTSSAMGRLIHLRQRPGYVQAKHAIDGLRERLSELANANLILSSKLEASQKANHTLHNKLNKTKDAVKTKQNRNQFLETQLFKETTKVKELTKEVENSISTQKLTTEAYRQSQSTVYSRGATIDLQTSQINELEFSRNAFKNALKNVLKESIYNQYCKEEENKSLSERINQLESTLEGTLNALKQKATQFDSLMNDHMRCASVINGNKNTITELTSVIIQFQNDIAKKTNDLKSAYKNNLVKKFVIIGKDRQIDYLSKRYETIKQENKKLMELQRQSQLSSEAHELKMKELGSEKAELNAKLVKLEEKHLQLIEADKRSKDIAQDDFIEITEVTPESPTYGSATSSSSNSSSASVNFCSISSSSSSSSLTSGLFSSSASSSSSTSSSTSSPALLTTTAAST